MPGHGIQGGNLGDENIGAGSARVDDENLLVRHSKRGIVTMLNNGPNSNGSEFLITFGATTYLDGYHNVVGEVVQGHDVLDQLEGACDREGNVTGDW